ncbi:MAG: hypothetical protein JXR48_00365 [Candidatus Delongbacteria bacterium]|nr:hypothetical protein [Candidatus Delongbacteria bacterium]MBN2833397.1 hypothetical protein [Candidatus Delongbacteria bacterium]
MNRISWYLIVMFILLNSCGNNYYDTNITVTQDAAEGLDLKALTELVKEVKNSEELEKRLNSDNSINNLDLNDDGIVDYLKVTEYGGGDAYGFSITTEPEKGEIQEVASVEISRADDRADINVRGNEQIYGSGAYYHDNSHFWRNMFLFSYFTNGFGMWRSPYYWGGYPSYYRSYTVVDRSSYRNRTSAYTSRSNAVKTQQTNSSISKSNPNKNAVATKGIKAGLKNPTSTQKNFQKRSTTKSVGAGGFGRKSSGSVRSSSSTRSRSFSRGGK